MIRKVSDSDCLQYTPGFPANWTSPLEIINLQVNGCTPYPNECVNHKNEMPHPVSGAEDQLSSVPHNFSWTLEQHNTDLDSLSATSKARKLT